MISLFVNLVASHFVWRQNLGQISPLHWNCLNYTCCRRTPEVWQYWCYFTVHYIKLFSSISRFIPFSEEIGRLPVSANISYNAKVSFILTKVTDIYVFSYHIYDKTMSCQKANIVSYLLTSFDYFMNLVNRTFATCNHLTYFPSLGSDRYAFKTTREIICHRCWSANWLMIVPLTV